MCCPTFARTKKIAFMPLVGAAALMGGLWPVGSARGAGEENFRTEFLRLCDVAAVEVNSATRKVPFYQDSYAIRGLGVAYDLTGRKEYLDACRKWSDRMVEFQSRMTPKGAYYMNYNRKPGEQKGDWYVADCCSIAMGVLATGVRCDGAERKRYFDSVKAFAKLVIDNYVHPSGGITDGLWSQYDGPWWCSSGVFGSLAFLLYNETHEETYLKAAINSLEWLNQLDFRQAQHISFKEAGPTVVMYIFEAYSAGLGHLKPDTAVHKAASANILKALQWMSENQAGRGAKTSWDYNSQWGSKFGGLPFHMYVYAKHLPECQDAAAAGDEEMRHISSVVFAAAPPKLSQLAAFALMSYAERVAPGAIYRSAKPSGAAGS